MLKTVVHIAIIVVCIGMLCYVWYGCGKAQGRCDQLNETVDILANDKRVPISTICKVCGINLGEVIEKANEKGIVIKDVIFEREDGHTVYLDNGDDEYVPETYIQEPVESGDAVYSENMEYVANASPESLHELGKVYDESGVGYTYYSENVLPGEGLDIPGRTVNEQGFVTDGDGNLCVASPDYEKGTVIDTPFGTAVVYDTGCPSGIVDMYTNW